MQKICMSTGENCYRNSNKNPTVNSVQRDYIAGEISKDLTQRVLLPQEIVDAHNEGLIPPGANIERGGSPVQANELFDRPNTILLDGGMGTMLQAAGP